MENKVPYMQTAEYLAQQLRSVNTLIKRRKSRIRELELEMENAIYERWALKEKLKEARTREKTKGKPVDDPNVIGPDEARAILNEKYPGKTIPILGDT